MASVAGARKRCNDCAMVWLTGLPGCCLHSAAPGCCLHSAAHPCTGRLRGARPTPCSRVPLAQGGGSEPLPPHKLSPHDIVRLRPSKGDASGAPLAEGVVYRVKEQAIVVAGVLCVVRGWVGWEGEV